jgi:DNA-binding MarR family transcriptional regulator
VSPRRRKPLFRSGWYAVHTELARELGSPYAAGVLEEIHQHAGPDGWAALSNDQLAATVGCTRGQVPKLVDKLAARGLLDTDGRDRHRRGRYRVVYEEAQRLVSSSDLSEDAAEFAANRAKNAAEPLPQNAAANPRQERDRGAENGQPNSATDSNSDLDSDLDSDSDTSPSPLQSLVDVAREAPQRAGRGRGRGPKNLFQRGTEREGRAPKGSIEEAVRVLGYCQPPDRCRDLGLAFQREDDPEDPHQWRNDWGPDFPEWAVVRVLAHVREYPGEVDWVRGRLAGVARRAQHQREARGRT